MKNFLLLLLPALFLCFTAEAQTVYFSEDFESGFPADWTKDGEWELTDAAGASSQYFAPAAHTMFMAFNDDAIVNGTGQKGRVETGPIDLAGASGTLVLYFESFFVNGDFQGLDETAKVYASTDDGATWEEIFNLESSGPWQEIGTVLPDYAGQTIRLAFEYDDGNQWNYGWCFDDVRISSPSVTRDGKFSYLNEEEFFAGGLVGVEVYPGGAIINNGVETIESVDLTWSDGNSTNTETITGLNIGFGETGLIESTIPFVIVDGSTDITVSISNVNGMGDDEDVSNDEGGTFTVSSVNPHPDKGVLVEEATGTWCQWCPRGAVFLEGMTHRYPGHFVGIAVHNQDPMVLAAYNTGITGFPDFPGFPSVVFNRVEILDPSEIEEPFLQEVTLAPPARLGVGAEFDDATRKLTVSVDAEFLESVGAGYKLNAILIEDGVTGTASTYDQINAYSGGGNGPMGGYELLPGAVPASMMVYDHVGRALLGGFNGATGSLPDAAEEDDHFGFTFTTYTIPATYNLDNIHIIGVLMDDQGYVVNVKSVTLDEAIENGLFVETASNEVFSHEAVSVSPNPFSDVTNINVNLANTANVTVQVYDAVGKLVVEKDYGQLSGANVLPFNATTLNNGMYFIHVRMDDVLATQRVMLTR
ncbi:MAG: Omp28-related outer membrane protein [Lewinellaceae bacterium]|nr:Omp28-related outer membrane protein [Saprospiraceae bacterium]MCB9336933.1 Omp28-related outer membrane protein [Lewinellaceae bacterium]